MLRGRTAERCTAAIGGTETRGREVAWVREAVHQVLGPSMGEPACGDGDVRRPEGRGDNTLRWARVDSQPGGVALASFRGDHLIDWNLAGGRTAGSCWGMTASGPSTAQGSITVPRRPDVEPDCSS